MVQADTDFYEVVHSPDDEDRTGKGFYAHTINADGSTAAESGLFATRAEAKAWAKMHGGRRLLSD